MGLYLNNAFSTKDAPNENLGRELLELHTVGRDGDYTEADVKTLGADPHRLPGRRVVAGFPPYYEPDDHYTGAGRR